jgi:tetratricopeptide (TPR) repeat protein
LGPARDVAREIWTRLDEARRTLFDEARRQAYDASLPPPLTIDDEPGTEESVEIDAGFLEGRVLLAQRDFAGARLAFERAVASRPDDVEFQAFLGWASVLDPAVERGVGVPMLQKARDAQPHAMRPLFFLGLAAAQEGRRDEAADLLQQASRMDPTTATCRRPSPP